MPKRIDIGSAKLTVAFAEGKLPAIDPADPTFVLNLQGVKIHGKVNAKAARRLAQHPGGAVLQGKLVHNDEQILIMLDCGFTWIDPKPKDPSEQPTDATQTTPTTDA
jgi:hypothetical protein